jgi:peptidoglycan-associated lipoprotein
LNSRKNWLVAFVLLIALFSVAGCKKKVKPQIPPTAPPAAAPAPSPTAQISASPSSITAGEQVVLTWSTTNATSASIDGIGDVPTSGLKTVTPPASTTYRLVAKGSGGTADAEVRVTVSSPPPQVTQPPASNVSSEEDFKAHVHDIFFDFDKYDIRSDATSTLEQDAAYLASHPDVKFTIGGYCDDRGSEEYNLALGQSRAQAAKTALVNAGIAASRIRLISYGKEKPFCTEENETCWQQNRRAGFTVNH